jgi:hypothetical protein
LRPYLYKSYSQTNIANVINIPPKSVIVAKPEKIEKKHAVKFTKYVPDLSSNKIIAKGPLTPQQNPC